MEPTLSKEREEFAVFHEDAHSKPRYEGLDQLRGLLALAVMTYHYLHFQNVFLPWFFQRPIDLLGLYAVSTFYALSGSAFYIVYHSEKVDMGFLRRFWIKRIFRIVPLFWLVTIATLLWFFWHSDMPQLSRVFLNFSLLFSWLEPAGYYATGAWSIGNEWAFYTLFPLLVWSSKTKLRFNAFCIIAFGIFVYYAFLKIEPHTPAINQWSVYVNPLNQFGIFLGGFVIGKYIVTRWRSNLFLRIIFISIFLFVTCSYLFSREECMYGGLRIGLAVISIFWCYGFGLMELSVSRFSKLLNWIGSISYTIYLTHPLFYRVICTIFKKMGFTQANYVFEQRTVGIIVMLVSIGATFLGSHIIYKFIERPAIRYGSVILRNRSSKIVSPKPIEIFSHR